MIDLSEGKGMSLQCYRTLIEELRTRGYNFVSYGEARRASRHVILRHDIDVCLFRALEMAELEAKLGVQAHYFILLNTESYNPGSTESRGILRTIAKLGHEIGLHFDSTGLREGDVAAMDAAVRLECDVLATYSDQNVRVVTFHRPAKWLINHQSDLGGRIHGYQPRFFSEIGYCSDSEGRFRFHQPLCHPAILAGHCLQLVIHPIWWCASPNEGPADKLVRYRREREKRLDEALAANCRPFVPVVQGRCD